MIRVPPNPETKKGRTRLAPNATLFRSVGNGRSDCARFAQPVTCGGGCKASANTDPDAKRNLQAAHIDDFAAGVSTDRVPVDVVDAALNESNRTVVEQHVHSTGMERAGADQSRIAPIGNSAVNARSSIVRLD